LLLQAGRRPRYLWGEHAATRIMDDLHVKFVQENDRLLPSIQYGVYDPSMLLELDTAVEKRMRAVGLDIFVQFGEGTIVVAANKNDASIQLGYQRYPRYPHWQSDLPNRIKVASVIGQVFAMTRVTSWNGYEYLWKPFWIFVCELHLRYPWGVIYRTFRRINLCRLPVKATGVGSFNHMWRQLLDGLKTLSLGIQIRLGELT
jgi:hypothetical protein